MCVVFFIVLLLYRMMWLLLLRFSVCMWLVNLVGEGSVFFIGVEVLISLVRFMKIVLGIWLVLYFVCVLCFVVGR